MNSEGGFYLEETDGKLILVYQHPKYRPKPQTQSPTSSVEAASHDHSFQPLYLCPISRWQKDFPRENTRYFPLNTSPDYVPSTPRRFGHPVLPLFWCNNKEFDVNGGCNVCRGSNFGTDYYICEFHETKYHKECVESPPRIKHPYHPQHSLQLYYYRSTIECYCCGREARNLVYYCAICQIFMHPICAMMPIPFVIDQPKRHDHPLTLFPRQTSLTCNVCGLLRKKYPTYICLRCNFVAHKDCMYFPRVIKISRHHHRISYISSLQSGEWFCGVCRQCVDGNYGAYTCDKCNNYAVHPRCALGKDVCDGQELEGVPEEDDITQDAGPFDMITEGVILHFLHNHRLTLELSMVYDENKYCQACVLPIFEGNFYSCMTCEFILHETCANAPRRIQHALHPHPLTLKAKCRYGVGAFGCNACYRVCRGFVYECHIKECRFDIDLRCASISEPFDYKGHEHPLFLALKPVQTPICHVCKTKCRKQLNCIKCDFIVCMKCATLPYRVRYKHDEHFLTVVCGEEVGENELCEMCECDLGIKEAKVFYRCSECYTTFHIECLFGGDIYIKQGEYQEVDGTEVQILGKRNISRPFCDNCKNRCYGKIFKTDDNIACSMECLDVFIEEV